MNDDESFFKSLNENLAQFYNSEDNCTNELYPLQNDLLNSTRYTDDKLIDSGAMKNVYEVTDSHSGRRVALARLRQADDEATVESFLSEARMTATLEHPNIIRLYDVGIDDQQRPWFTMELIPGQSLQEILDNIASGDSRLSDEWTQVKRLDLFIKICEALAYAHSRGILHLDIKPANIRIGEYGEVLLCDWGLSHLDDDANELVDLANIQTLHGYIKGTPGYMPADLENRKTVTADIFGLGAVLYTLLTGTPPFNGTSLKEVLENTRCEKFSAIQKHRHIPPGLLSICFKALSHEQKKRYKDVDSLLLDVEKYRSGYATEAENAGPLKQLKLFIKRNRTACSLVLLFSVTLVFLTGAFINSLQQSRKQALTAQQESEATLRKLQKEQHAKNRTNRHYSRLLVLHSRMKTEDFDFKSALDTVNQAVKKDPENMEAVMQKGFTHFIRFEFDKAYDCFSQSDMNTEDLHTASEQMKNLGHNAKTEDIIAMLKGFGSVRDYMRVYMLVIHSRKFTRLEHSKFIRYMIEHQNPEVQLQYEFNGKRNLLSLAGSRGLKDLYTIRTPLFKSFCILKTLRLKRLNLSDTDFENLSQINDLKLEVLDLRRSAVQDIKALHKMTSLKKVILTENQKHMAQGNWSFNIIFRD